MASYPIKVELVVNDFVINVISTVIMNYCRNLDMKQFQVTIVAGAPIAPLYRSECEALGIKWCLLPERKTSPGAYYKALFSVLSRKRFDIVHVHGNSATITPELFFAWIKGIKIRIAHSHSSNCTHLKAHRLLLPLFNRLYTHAFACSNCAGEWLFGKKAFILVPNGFTVSRFRFSEEKRQQVRAELGLEDKFVLGQVGLINATKNQHFMLKLFESIAPQASDTFLLLIGTGPDFDKVSELVSRHPYRDRILLYGESKDPSVLYNAMDVFVFPSIYEGLGIVLLEAQMNGLKCVVSDSVPEEVRLGSNVSFLSLEENIQKWVEEILAPSQIDRDSFYQKNIEAISQYDIRENALALMRLYKKMYRKT